MPIDEFRRVFLIYCLDRQPDGSYVALNRHYKPVGDMRRDWINYQDTHGRFNFKREMTGARAERISCRGDADTSRIYLYSDACVPTASAEHWETYCARLRELANLQIAVV